MESMHLTARLVIEQNMSNTTAFSARPGAPVRPMRERHRMDAAIPALRRVRFLARRRSPLRHAAT